MGPVDGSPMGDAKNGSGNLAVMGWIGCPAGPWASHSCAGQLKSGWSMGATPSHPNPVKPSKSTTSPPLSDTMSPGAIRSEEREWVRDREGPDRPKCSVTCTV